jgi:hypothetical protein
MASKPGKYAAFKKLYPKTPIEATSFDRINEVLNAPAFPNDPHNKMRVRDLNNTQLKDLYVVARKAADELEAKTSVIETQIAALNYMFVQRMEEDDVTSLPFTDGVTLGASVEPYPNVIDRTALTTWIKSTGQEDLLTLNYQTLASIVKAMLLEGKPLPPGVDVYMKDKLSARGLKTKAEGVTTNED